jgi:hypothetical protein
MQPNHTSRHPAPQTIVDPPQRAHLGDAGADLLDEAKQSWCTLKASP